MKSRPPRRKNMAGPNDFNAVTPFKLRFVIVVENNIVANLDLQWDDPAVTKFLAGSNLQNLKPLSIIIVTIHVDNVRCNGSAGSLEWSHD